MAWIVPMAVMWGGSIFFAVILLLVMIEAARAGRE